MIAWLNRHSHFLILLIFPIGFAVATKYGDYDALPLHFKLVFVTLLFTGYNIYEAGKRMTKTFRRLKIRTKFTSEILTVIFFIVAFLTKDFWAWFNRLNPQQDSGYEITLAISVMIIFVALPYIIGLFLLPRPAWYILNEYLTWNNVNGLLAILVFPLLNLVFPVGVAVMIAIALTRAIMERYRYLRWTSNSGKYKSAADSGPKQGLLNNVKIATVPPSQRLDSKFLRTHLKQIDILQQQGNYKEARSLINWIIEKYEIPNEASVLLNLLQAINKSMLGDVDAAWQIIQVSQNVETPNMGHLYDYIAEIFVQTGRFSEAQSIFQLAIKNYGDANRPFETLVAQSGLVLAMAKAGDDSQIEAFLNKVKPNLSLGKPKYRAILLFRLSLMATLTDHKPLAREYLQAILNLDCDQSYKDAAQKSLEELDKGNQNTSETSE